MLIKNFIATLLLVTISALSALAFGSANMNHEKKEEVKNVKREILDAKTKRAILEALEINERLHAAFFKYSPAAVEANARKLKGALEGIKHKQISLLMAFSLKKLGNITAKAKQDTNNKNYNLVSMALIHIITKYDVGTDYNAYNCPMVKKKWIQNSKKMAKVHNPYASEMPHCGAQISHL